MIRMAMLHGDLDSCIESHGIGEMPPIRDLIMRHLTLVYDRTSKRERIFLHAPSLTEIILASSAVHGGGPSVIVDEDYVIPFPPPASLEMID